MYKVGRIPTEGEYSKEDREETLHALATLLLLYKDKKISNDPIANVENNNHISFLSEIGS